MKDNPSFEYVSGKISAVDAKIGTLSELETASKSDVVSAVNELFTSVSDGKALVASAITDKGVSTQSDATFAVMAANVRNIPTGAAPTGTKQITITENGTTTEDVSSYAAAEITVNVSGGGLPSNYRCGTFTLSYDVAGTAPVKVVELDAEALSHINDSTLLLSIMARDNPTLCGSLGCTIGNNAFGGTRYGFGFYQVEDGKFSSQIMTTPANQTQSAGIARAFVGTDGVYIIGNAGYKWKARNYNYSLVW